MAMAAQATSSLREELEKVSDFPNLLIDHRGTYVYSLAGGRLMDIKEGHPGAIFHWFFDSDQGTQHMAQMLLMLHGTGAKLTALAKQCLDRQSEFDDALGPEILFAFFDPDLASQAMAEDGIGAAGRFKRSASATYLFAGYGEAHPVPQSLKEVGRGRFRSVKQGRYGFEKIATEAAKAHTRAVPFFQQAFDLKPLESYLLIAHREQRITKTFELTDDFLISPDEILQLIRSLRPIARHPRGADDLYAIEIAVSAHVNRSMMRSVAQVFWKAIGDTIGSARSALEQRP